MAAWFWKSHERPRARRAGDDLLRSLALIIEPDTLRASIASRVRELLGCTTVIVCSLRPDTLAYSAAYSTLLDAPVPEVAFTVAGTLCRWLKTNQEPLLVPHPGGAFEYLDHAEQAVLTMLGVRACLPIFSGVRLVSILLICSDRADWRLTDTDFELLIRLGAQSGLALENAELHQLERERLRNLHRAEQLAVAGQLAATVAHEIRNPLTAIRSTVQYVLESTAAWEAKRSLLEGTLDEVDRIERTVGGVLALSRSTEGELVELDLIRNVEQAALVIQAYAQAHNVTIERQFEVNSLPISGDPRGLHQVCINLFMNACQAMADGGKLTLTCGVRQPSPEGRPVALLQVSDTGCGISRDHLRQVFNPFFTTKQTGTGLGLPICLDIVTRHGGSLRLESIEGQGTGATVLLPLRLN
jgi:signal transduction histidine kinase